MCEKKPESVKIKGRPWSRHLHTHIKINIHLKVNKNFIDETVSNIIVNLVSILGSL